MSMTTAQLATLKTAILADANLTALVASFSTGAIKDYLNTPTAAYYVWQTAVSTQTLYDNITWANFTPVDAPDGTATWTNRALACQGKQFNVQIILQGRDTLNASKANVRAGLQDALTAIPSGVAGANKSGGWTNVQTAMQRLATNGEKVFASGLGTTASPSTLGFEGYIQDSDVVQALTT